MIALWFLSGCQTAGRQAIGFNYFVEFAPKSAHSYMSTIWNIVEGLVFMIQTLTYRLITKNWRPIFIFALGLNIAVLIVLFFILPESPKWLYNKKKYKQF